MHDLSNCCFPSLIVIGFVWRKHPIHRSPGMPTKDAHWKALYMLARASSLSQCKCARCFLWTMTMLLDLHFTPKFQPPMVTTASHPTTKKQTHYYFPLQELRILDRKITKLINGLRISSSNDCWFASLVRIVVRVDAKLSNCTVQYSYWIQLRLAKMKSISCIYLPIDSFARVCL